jgi:hypothetical protein
MLESMRMDHRKQLSRSSVGQRKLTHGCKANRIGVYKLLGQAELLDDSSKGQRGEKEGVLLEVSWLK